MRVTDKWQGWFCTIAEDGGYAESGITSRAKHKEQGTETTI
jgi:hypothetical protein